LSLATERNTTIWYFGRARHKESPHGQEHILHPRRPFRRVRCGPSRGRRYKNATDVIRSGLRLLEEHETRLEALRLALVEGEESGVAGVAGPLDMEKIKRQAREDAGLAPS
jgi:putative addiction module CopG family antidote